MRILTERTELLLSRAMKIALVDAADRADVAPAEFVRMAIQEKLDRDAAPPAHRAR